MIVVIGAGLAGLSAALTLADAGHRVTVLEAASAAGGRCRSYEDRELGCRIDNGNHLLLSGNDAAFAYLRRICATHTLAGPATSVFPFIDLATRTRWTLHPGPGRAPWWLFSPARRVPGTRPTDYLSLLRWLRVPPGAHVTDISRPSTLHHRLIEPLAIAALNTMPDRGDATLMAAIIRQTLLRSGAACIPRVPALGLSESFIDPALAALRAAGATVQFGRRATALHSQSGCLNAVSTTAGDIAADAAVLAVPAPVAATLLPGLTVPDAFESILNLHFRIDVPPTEAGFIGLVGGLAEWIFIKPGIVSVTVSAANRHADLPPDQAAAQVWEEVAIALSLSSPMPPHRVVRERRATFAATPAQSARRPRAGASGIRNLGLAGDWTATGLPATIEGAIRSGVTAANHVAQYQFSTV